MNTPRTVLAYKFKADAHGTIDLLHALRALRVSCDGCATSLLTLPRSLPVSRGMCLAKSGACVRLSSIRADAVRLEHPMRVSTYSRQFRCGA